MTQTVPTICRNCGAFCPILVSVEGDRVVKAVGDPESVVFEGYICPKGRMLPAQHNDPARLLASLKRGADGSFAQISSGNALEEIAAELRDIIKRHGPRSVAVYIGTGTQAHLFGPAMAAAVLRAIGSPMMFSASTIDKPAEKISIALHGSWHAGAQNFESSDTWMVVGANPVIAKSNGVPFNNPGMRLKTAVKNGMKLIVIDPRRTQTAQRAYIHLQPFPGEDPTILAGIIHIIIEEQLYDEAFVALNAHGFDELRQAVSTYTPEYAAARAGIPMEDLVEAARAFGRGRRGGVVCSTGPSFSTRSNLSFYLGLCLNTLCGRWAREGDLAPYPNVLLPAFVPRAEPRAPYSPFGANTMRVMGLKESVSGMPTMALPEEMMLEGDGQVKALFCIGGNPVVSWPDQRKTEAGLKALRLLVTLDVRMSATAKLAHYVIATPLSLEVPGTTYLVESLKYYGVSRGYQAPWAQYTPAIVAPPAGSDLTHEHQLFFGLAQRLGLQLDWINYHGLGKHMESPTQVIPFDMTQMPTQDAMISLITNPSRIPLSEVKKYPHGHLFDLGVRVAPRDPNCADRLEIGNPMMMAELAEIRDENYRARQQNSELPFRLVCRRANNFCNSILTGLPANTANKAYNPAFMHPQDLVQLGLKIGDLITIRSHCASLLAIAEADASLRRGVVSMTHGFGAQGVEADQDPRIAGSNVNLLIDSTEADPISGIPRMSGIPICVVRAPSPTS